MDLIITATDEVASDETSDLWSWLEREEDLRAQIKLRPSDIPSETMGAEYFIVASLAAVSVLARSICEYLVARHNRRGSDIVLKITTSSGGLQEVKVNRTTDAVELTKLFLQAGAGSSPKRQIRSAEEDDAPAGS
ncbi:hypothetical protein AB0C15_21700 [Micromonospora sp. NPDC048835]|uniref:effector-associated constant component EACC1 n=1 Tax=Micromonospora sp. NPDC048835 TaxID=3155147 RepID=UPI0033D9D089